MRRWYSLLAACLFLAASVSVVDAQMGDQAGGAVPFAASRDVVVRTSLRPREGIVVGQHVRLLVDVLFRGEMPRPPRVAVPEPSGAQVFRFETQATTMSDSIDGVDYAGQRFEFGVYPRRGGTLVVPAAAVTLLDREGAVTGTVHGEEVRTDVAVPEGVDPSGPVVATRQLTLTESWQPDPGTPFTAGDAIEKTLTRTAADVPGLAMRDLAFPAPPGVRVYVQPPRVQDRINRGEVSGQRIDHVTYVFETAGTFELPAPSQPWWNLDGHRGETAIGKAVTVTVVAAPLATRLNRAIQNPGFWRRPSTWGWMAAALAVLGAVLLAARSLARRFMQWKSERRRAWEASEAKAFHDLLTACGRQDAAGIYRAFVKWRKRLSRSAKEEVAVQAVELEEVLFGSPEGQPAWDAGRSRAFATGLRLKRDLILRAASQPAPALPPLNPARG